MQCPRCYFDNAADARWCGYCGSDLAGVQDDEPATPGRAAAKHATRLGAAPAPLDEDDPFRAAAAGLRGGAARREPPAAPPPAPPPASTPRPARHATVVDQAPPAVQAEVVGALIVLGLDGAATAHVLRAGRTTLGRDPGNDLVIDDPRASGGHAILRVEGGRAWLLDTSTNGTRVGDRVIAADRVDVIDGTVLEIGRTLIVVQLLDSDTLGILRGAGP